MRSARSKGLKDPAYLAFVHEFTCVACAGVVVKRVSGRPVQAHHAGARGLGQKCSDRETIPLCSLHHLVGKDAIHVLGRRFWDYHGLDKDRIIETLNKLYDSREK
jgi:hypothetical protein